MNTIQNDFFKDLVVVELASVLAGPAVGMFFAELGARVIKIENKKTGGDVTRKWRLPSESKDASISAYYSSVNYKKEVMFANLMDTTEKATVLDLVAKADVVISNYRPASARKMGFDADTLRKRNPNLIFAELTGYGADDSRPAFDVVLQAEAGFLYMNGESDGEPVKMPVALIDILAAHQLKEGILVALLNRFKTGKGAFVTTSLLESAISSLANQATNWLMGNHIPQKMGTMHPNIAPYGDIFVCADKKPLILAVGTEKQFVSLCEVLNIRELSKDKQFSANGERVKNRVALKSILLPIFVKEERDVWLQKLYAESVPVGSIRNMQEVFLDEKAQKMILEEMQEGILTRRVKTVAFTVET
ncbi:MAG: crotonobetainyl-CoA:carnitine CoA-transferase CaiB-like acyl-CoA transferase [Saprospiraceae bacterium]|jgi:crotonobetainyl-CoA:carnitine CoA-transferase CaiB-like acyl-CoA transferase